MDKKILDMGIVNILPALFHVFKSGKEREMESR